MDNKTLREFIRNHTTLVEDIRYACNRLPKHKEAALISNLRQAADELAEYDMFLCKEHVNPFKVETMNEAIANAVPAWQEQTDWTISSRGDLENKKWAYLIQAGQLREKDWILHMMEKKWCNLNTFIPAYFEACSRAGIKEMSILTNY